MLNTEYPLSFAMRMDESLGLELLETVSGTKLPLSTGNGVYPAWQEPWEKYVMCEGHSRYAHGYDYCQYDEKFLTFVTPHTFEFIIKKDPMMNSTFMMWALISQFGTSGETLKVKLQDRYEWVIQDDGISDVRVGSSLVEAARRNDINLIGRKGWVLLYLRVVYPAQLVFNHIGYADPTIKNKIITEGTLSSSANFFLPSNLAGLKFQLIHGTGAKIFMRNLQLWNSPFSLELAKLRSLRAPNPMRFKNNLVALYRFDEAGGNALYNTAAYQHEHDTKRIVDSTRSYIRWAYFS